VPGLFAKKSPEPTAAEAPAANLADKARLRTQTLTQELLDWTIAALEAVLKTPQMQALGNDRVRTSFKDALKNADKLYPLTIGGTYANKVRKGEGLVLGVEGPVQEPEEGGASSEGGLRPRV